MKAWEMCNKKDCWASLWTNKYHYFSSHFEDGQRWFQFYASIQNAFRLWEFLILDPYSSRLFYNLWDKIKLLFYHLKTSLLILCDLKHTGSTGYFGDSDFVLCSSDFLLFRILVLFACVVTTKSEQIVF